MSALARAGQVYLVLLGLINVVFSASVYAPSDEPFPDHANALIATWGVGFGILVVVLATAGLASRQLWAWAALWTAPAFLAAHVVLLGTWIPDGVLLLLAVLALVATKPETRIYASGGTEPTSRLVGGHRSS